MMCPFSFLFGTCFVVFVFIVVQFEMSVVIIEDEKLMEETPAQEQMECMDYSTLQEQQMDVEKFPTPLASHESEMGNFNEVPRHRGNQ